MKTITRELLGFEVPLNGVAETLEEIVSAAGNDTRVVDLANNYVLFHGHYDTVRDKIIETLVKLTGKKLETDDKGKVTEKNTEYIARLEEDDDVKAAGGLAAYESQIVEAVNALTVDYTKTVRAAGDSAPAKKWLAYYDQLVADGKLDKFIAKHEIDISGLDDEAIKVLVARKLKEVVTNAQRAALAAAAGL